MAEIGKFDALQRKHPVLGFPIAVAYKFFDDFGGYLAALITYYGFVSLFPLLLLLTTVLGIVLRDYPDLQEKILDSALSEIPVVGDQLRSTGTISGGPAGVAIGLGLSLYGGLGVAQALQYTLNTAWMVPRNSRPNPFASRGRGMLLILTAGLALIATTALSTLGSIDVSWLGGTLKTATPFLAIAINASIFTFAFILGTARRTTVRQQLPGAIVGALLWQVIQSFGVVYVSRVVQRASSVNAVFAVVLGLIAFLYLAGVIAVICTEINVVLARKLYPRALLTPFTDNVVLTEGDMRAYSGMAKAQRLKGYERIGVVFRPDEPKQKSRRKLTAAHPAPQPPADEEVETTAEFVDEAAPPSDLRDGPPPR
ncbi:YihY/virulence factor BrkB family protein [Actinomycetota bacterium]